MNELFIKERWWMNVHERSFIRLGPVSKCKKWLWGTQNLVPKHENSSKKSSERARYARTSTTCCAIMKILRLFLLLQTFFSQFCLEKCMFDLTKVHSPNPLLNEHSWIFIHQNVVNVVNVFTKLANEWTFMNVHSPTDSRWTPNADQKQPTLLTFACTVELTFHMWQEAKPKTLEKPSHFRFYVILINY